MKTVEWAGGRVRFIDQTRLPIEVKFIETDDYRVVAQAIRTMQVRGAPAIGVAAAMGAALGALEINSSSREEFLSRLSEVINILRSTRPTAVNLFWALDRMERRARESGDPASVRQALVEEAQAIAAEDEAANRRMGALGAALIPDGSRVLTHCNAGGLATAGYGTALGVLRAAHEVGKRLHVYVDETRPLLQGARLTAWELAEEGIPLTVITDNMAGYLMSLGRIDCVIVGADRIAANGDVANKIGTYSVAVLAHAHGIPFYVAAPTSTVDLCVSSGDRIPIEERSQEEVLTFQGVRAAPWGAGAFNPAFDVTPHRYVAAIITEEGIVREPYEEGLKEICERVGRETVSAKAERGRTDSWTKE
ncbi:MAG TPA: S-methyl-5-thioribose-1-phosphate isomerase [Dehalococcoidia bacterium]|nr:S-methyl-5-thioribose-1-phosphate isomerase [Dehalococcoidia bacterium]